MTHVLELFWEINLSSECELTKIAGESESRRARRGEVWRWVYPSTRKMKSNNQTPVFTKSDPSPRSVKEMEPERLEERICKIDE